MTNFKIALGKFLAGEVEFAQVISELDAELATNPQSAPELLNGITTLYGQGRLPGQLYEMLKQRIPQQYAPPPQQPYPPQGQPPQGQPPQQPYPHQGQPPHGQPPQGQPPQQPYPPQGQPPQQPYPPQGQPPQQPYPPQGQPPQQPAPPQGQPPVADDGEKTQFRVKQPAQSPPADDGEKTVFRGPSGAPPRPPAAPDQTGQPTGQQTGPFTGQQTGQQTGQHTGQHTGQQTGPFTGQPAPPGPQTGPFTGQSGQFTGQPGQTGQTGQTGKTGQTWQTGASSWSNPDQWTTTEEGAPTVGTILKERFVLESIIGQGGMGIVFKAKDLRKEEAQDRNPYLAVKILNEEFKQHPESLKALQRESRKAQDLAHPNIVTVFDFDRAGGNVFMTMEYMDGESLDRFVKRHPNGLQQERALQMIRDMSAGLAYAHDRHIIHSDFKPANAFLAKNGVVKIFDFGIARAAKRSDQADGEKTLFDAGSLGALTPAYATIPMIEGDDPDQRDDIYALACVAYELLCGKHPYNKRSALKAKNAGMVPKPIEGLNRRQWKTLQKGLAFDRESQPDNVRDFMDGLEPKKINKMQAIAGGVAALLVIVFLATWIPDFIHGRYLEGLAETLESGSDEGISLAIEDLAGLTPEDRSRVYPAGSDAREGLVEYYSRAIAAVFNPDNGLYDFPAAGGLIEEAGRVLPDSATIDQYSDNADRAKSALEREIGQKITAAIESNILLSTQGADSAEELQAIAFMVSPEDPPDARLAGAFAEQGQAAFDSGEIGLAESLVLAGLGYAPDDPVLANLQTEINNQIVAYEEAQRIAALETALAGLSRQSGVNEFDQAIPQIQELRTLRPTGAVARQIERDLQSVLTDELGRLNQLSDFAGARQQLEVFREIADGQYFSAQEQSILQAERAFNTNISNLLADIERTAAAGGFTPPNQDKVEPRLLALKEAGADAATMALARRSVTQGYLDAAVGARGAGNFEQARALVTLGQSSAPDSDISEFLQQELADIETAERNARAEMDAAERQRLAAERQQTIDTLQQEFSATIAKSDFTIDDGRRLANSIQRLRGLGVTDGIVRTGQDQIAGALVRQGQSLAASGDWSAARELAAAAQNLLPQNAAISGFVDGLEDQYQAAQQQRANEALRSARDNYNRLMAATVVDRDWLDDVWNTRDRLGESSAFVTNSNREIAEKLSRQISSLASLDRYPDARDLLGRGFALLPNDPYLEAAATNLDRAEAAFAKRAQERNAEAELQARIKSVRLQAEENDIDGAIAAYQVLRRELGDGHQFVSQDAPIWFADAYRRLAKTDERVGRLEDALAKLDLAAEWAPSYGPLQDDRERVRELIVQGPDTSERPPSAEEERERSNERIETIVAAVRGKLNGAAALNVSELERDLGELRSLSGDEYRQREQALADIAVGQLERMQGGNPAAANARLAALRTVFPEQAAIHSYQLPEASQAAATTTTTSVPTVTRRIPKGPDACGNPALAGRGTSNRGTCRDGLSSDKKGPVMVVIPAGGPVPQRFAISKYEVTVFDYNIYCELSNACTPLSGVQNAMPMTGISIEQAQAYATWLSDTTGFEYRMPSGEEWQYAAEAPGTGEPPKNFNCQIRANNELIKGKQLETVTTGDANGWGLKNSVGNAQEWVSGSGSPQVRGGSYRDSYDECAVSKSAPHNGQPDAITGFRLVREVIGGTS